MNIQSVRLETPSLAPQCDFYHTLLDLDFQTEADGSLRLRTGASALIFCENVAAAGIYHFAFNIPCNQIEEAKKWLERRAVPLIPGLQGECIIQFPNWHARSVYFFDPAGNIVEFIARDDLANGSARAFGPEALLEISEIGIVVRDVAKWRTEATRRYGVGDFDKQPALPSFAALGSDRGLFIVVPQGRRWFLTDIPATVNALIVDFENEKGQAHRIGPNF